MKKVELRDGEVRKVNADIKALILAKCFKLVIKGKPVGAKFRQGGLCFIEPVNIDEMGAPRQAVLIRAGKFKRVKSFVFEHSTVGYKYLYRGPKLQECLHAIANNLSKEEFAEIAKTGAVFTAEEAEGLGNFIRDPYSQTCPVKITIYEDKSGRLPQDIASQNVKFKGVEFTPDQISSIARAESLRIDEKSSLPSGKATGGKQGKSSLSK